MAEFGSAKLKFLKRFLKLRHGIPSHDTFSTVFRMLDPKALDAAFGQLTATLVAALAKGGVTRPAFGSVAISIGWETAGIAGRRLQRTHY